MQKFSNPAKILEPVTIALRNNQSIKVLPFHLLPSGTHKEVTYCEIFNTLPESVTEVVESSTGNSAIAAALYAKHLSLPITVFLPQGTAEMKIEKLRHLGAKIELTPRAEYTTGARKRAQTYAEESVSRYLLNQAANPANYLSHRAVAHKLAMVNRFVCAGGTYGTIRGFSEYFAESFTINQPKEQPTHSTKIFVIELDAAPHLYNRKLNIATLWRDHKIPGLAPSSLPLHAEKAPIDAAFLVTEQQAEEIFAAAIRCELNIGKTSAINLAVARRMADDAPKDAIIGTVTCDNVDRYDIPKSVAFDFSSDRLQAFLNSQVVASLPLTCEFLR